MPKSTSQPRRTARGLAVLLWAIGSAYLISTGLDVPNPNTIEIAATPAIWLAVIALPVLAGHAWADRAWTSFVLLVLAALIGSAYTLTGTIGRHAETRDVRVATAADTAQRKVGIERKLAEAESMLAEARRRFAAECSGGIGKKCHGIEATISVYEGATVGHQTSLDRLGRSEPLAIERRIAAAVALVSGHAEARVMPVVGMVLPALFGLLIELGALACAMYGWALVQAQAGRPATLVAGAQAGKPATRESSAAASDVGRQSDYPAISASESAALLAMLRPDDRDRGGPGPSGPHRPGPAPDRRQDEVLAGLLTDLGLGRSAPSQRELCERFGVPRSTMSDWLVEWERSGLIPARRTVGRCKILTAA